MEVSGELLNEFNNHLSAVIGTAELAAKDGRLSEETRNRLRLITEQAEQAVSVARRSLVSRSEVPPKTAQPDLITQDIRRELDRIRVAGNLYMAGRRPREIDLKLGSVPPITLPALRFGELFRTLLDRFAALADDDDVFTVATYVRERPRLPRHFPAPAQFPAGHTDRRIRDATCPRTRPSATRPADVYLSHVLDTGTAYAVDGEGGLPAYLSFRFPAAGKGYRIGQPTRSRPAAPAGDRRSAGYSRSHFGHGAVARV